ncbi:MAG: MFS transporter [Gemmatimonadetes bacterium]|nr:MFS transporter [Gemmatimonadota bacterium]
MAKRLGGWWDTGRRALAWDRAASRRGAGVAARGDARRRQPHHRRGDRRACHAGARAPTRLGIDEPPGGAIVSPDASAARDRYVSRMTAVAPDASPTTASLDDVARKRILTVLFVGVFMAALDAAVVAPAVPALRAAFGVDNRQIGLVTIVFSLGSLTATALMAALSDRFGRRAIYLLDVAGFALGSAIIATAPSFGVLLVGRAIQGLSAGGITPTASAVVGDLFPSEQRGRVLGLIGATFGMAFLFGPVIASVLLVVASWPWIFLLNLPIAVVVFVMGARALPTARAFETLPPLRLRRDHRPCRDARRPHAGHQPRARHGAGGDAVARAPHTRGDRRPHAHRRRAARGGPHRPALALRHPPAADDVDPVHGGRLRDGERDLHLVGRGGRVRYAEQEGRAPPPPARPRLVGRLRGLRARAAPAGRAPGHAHRLCLAGRGGRAHCRALVAALALHDGDPPHRRRRRRRRRRDVAHHRPRRSRRASAQLGLRTGQHRDRHRQPDGRGDAERARRSRRWRDGGTARGIRIRRRGAAGDDGGELAAAGAGTR